MFQGMDPNARLKPWERLRPFSALQLAPDFVASVSRPFFLPPSRRPPLRSPTRFQSVEPRLKSVAISGAAHGAPVMGPAAAETGIIGSAAWSGRQTRRSDGAAEKWKS